MEGLSVLSEADPKAWQSFSPHRSLLVVGNLGKQHRGYAT
jgi:hypothetical protein